MIVLDIGNSRIKCFEVYDLDNIKIIFNIKANETLLKSYLKLIIGKDIYTVSTNKTFENFIISNKLKTITAKDFEKKTGFLVPYESYGIDRLINSYSASNLYNKNILVVSLGSAITYDIVKNSKISYGYITPGINMRLECLCKNIPHLSTASNNTKKAMENGILKEILSTIKDIKNEENIDVVLTGGDSYRFLNVFKIDTYLLPKGIFLGFSNL